jgi:ABC-type multidrug transport system fused ATPase/permease subunit
MKNIKKIIDLLSFSQRKKAFILLILILIMALLDMLGVASVLPFMAVLANPNLVETNVILIYLYQAINVLGVSSIEQFLFALGIGSFFLLLVSLFFRALTTYYQVHFSLMQEYNICSRLVEGYLRQPYSWFLNKHSADLSKNILSEVNEIINKTIVPFINLLVYGAVSFTIVLLLVLVDPILAISVGLTLSICFLFIFILMKNLLSYFGSERLQSNEKRFRVVNEVFSAIKEVKIYGTEEVYSKRFKKPAKVYAENQILVSIISQLPRFLLEAVSFGGMIVLILVLISNGDSFQNIIPILSLYAFAGYRLIPALQQIYYAITQMQFSYPSLNSLHKDITNLNHIRQEASDIINIKHFKKITLNNIYFSYPNSLEPALKSLNLTILAHSKVGIVGLTGSGKSTTVDLILGLLESQQGSLLVDDTPITVSNKRTWQKKIGYVPQKIYLVDASVSANIAFGIDEENIDQKKVERAARISNIHEFIMNDLPNGYKTRVGENGVRLSGGQRQRIGIARALYHDPQVLILDEATSSLDNLTEKAVMDSISKLANNITIIIIAHRLSTVKNCNNIFLLEKGELKAQGEYDELIKINEDFQKMTVNR